MVRPQNLNGEMHIDVSIETFAIFIFGWIDEWLLKLLSFEPKLDRSWLSPHL